MPTIDLDTIPQVATEFQNEDHRVEAELVNRCVEALEGPVPALTALLGELEAHTRAHFLREDEAMRRTGFPPFHVHHEEHERVLLELSVTRAHFEANGDTKALGAWLKGPLVDWFVQHIQTMDSVTARWIHSHGGTPAG